MNDLKLLEIETHIRNGTVTTDETNELFTYLRLARSYLLKSASDNLELAGFYLGRTDRAYGKLIDACMSFADGPMRTGWIRGWNERNEVEKVISENIELRNMLSLIAVRN